MAKILLTEDDDGISFMVAQRLEMLGHEVAPVYTAAEALALAHDEPFDVILMDVGLPRMDGYEATRRLKSDPATAGVPVIILTAFAGQEDRRNALEAGADEYESKPIDFDRLEEKIVALTAKK